MNRRPIAPLWALLSLCAMVASPALAQVEVALNIAQADPPLYGHQNFNREGLTVRAAGIDDGDSLVVVTHFEQGASCPTRDPVRVYRLDETGYTLEASFDPLTFPGTVPTYIDMHGDTLVIADDPRFEAREGRVLIYRRANRAWTFEAELRASDPEPWDGFGQSVSIFGDTVAVGAPNEGSNSTITAPRDGRGAVYVYRRTGTTWTQIDKIGDGDDVGSTLDIRDEFGKTVDIIDTPLQGNRILVGAPGHQVEDAPAGGAAMLFDEGDGFNSFSLYAPEHESENRFGVQLGMGTGVAGIGSTTRAHLYVVDDRFLRKWEVIPIEGGAIDRIDADGFDVIVGQPDADGAATPGSGRATAYHWVPNNGFSVIRVEPYADARAGDRIGAQAVIGGAYIHVGLPGSDVAGNEAGAVLSYTRSGSVGVPRGRIAGRLATGDAVPDARFAADLDTDGQRLIAGVPGNVPCPEGIGGSAFVYVLQNDRWRREANLSADDVAPGSDFGAAVAIDGATIAVGAPNDGPGSVHIYELTSLGWQRVARILPSQPVGNERFGADLDLEFGRLVIGVPGGTSDRGRTGYAITYTRTTQGWLPEARFPTPAELAGSDEYGASVSINGNRIAVGAPGNAQGRGLAFAYEAPFTDPAISVLAPTTNSQDQRFGHAVAATTSDILIGAPDLGTVELFENNAGRWIRKQQAPIQSTAGFGTSLAVSGLTAAIGDGQGTASIYYRENGEWISYGRINNPTSVAADGFGSSVAIFDRELVVGAPLNDAADPNSGAAYSYLLDFTFTVPECADNVEANEIAEFRPFSDQSSAWFGYRVDADGDTAIVGSPYTNIEGEDALGRPRIYSSAGEAIIYKRTGVNRWERQAFLHDEATPGLTNGRFGHDVGISGDLAIVGVPLAPGRGVNDGAANIYRRERRRTGDVWILEDTVISDGSSIITQFGVTADIDGTTAVVGAPISVGLDGDNAEGSAFVFERRSDGTWSDGFALRPSDGAFGDQFGHSVAIDGDWIAVGTVGHDAMGINGSGAVYLFQRQPAGVWTEVTKLLSPNIQSLEAFGFSIDMDNGLLVIGALHGDTPVAPSTGSAYVYRYNMTTASWAFEQRLFDPEGRQSDSQGRSVAVANDTIAVGAISGYNSDGRGRPGAVTVYIYEPNLAVWAARERITPPDQAGAQRFGEALALAGGNLWVGHNYGDGDGSNGPTPVIDSGRAHTFDLECRPPDSPLDLALPLGVINIADLFEFFNRYSAALNSGIYDPTVDLAAPIGSITVTDLFAAITEFTSAP